MNSLRQKIYIGLGQKIVYAIPVIGIYFLMGPIAILQGIYAKYFGLSLISIAKILLISRLFDAFSDPIVGHLSDRYIAQKGTRKPIIILGGVFFAVSSYFLYVPPNNVSELYFLLWFLAFYLSYTLFEISHLAWASDLCHTSRDKNSLYGLRAFCLHVGFIIFYGLPLLPIFSTSEFTPLTLKWAALIAGVIILPSLYLSWRYVPDNFTSSPDKNPFWMTEDIDSCNAKAGREGNKVKEVVEYKNPKIENGIWGFLSEILNNYPFQIFVISYLLVGIGIGMWFVLLFIFVDSYLDLGEGLPLILVLSMSLAALSLSGWHRLAVMLSKPYAWSLAQIISAIGLVGTGFLTPEIANEWLLLVVVSLVYSSFAANNILAPSLLADIAEYSTWRFGFKRTASYFAAYTFIMKAAVAIGGALALAIAGWYEYDPAIKAHDENSIFGLRVATAWLPAVIVSISSILIFFIPVNSHRQAIIQRALDRKEHTRLYV